MSTPRRFIAMKPRIRLDEAARRGDVAAWRLGDSGRRAHSYTACSGNIRGNGAHIWW